MSVVRQRPRVSRRVLCHGPVPVRTTADAALAPVVEDPRPGAVTGP